MAEAESGGSLAVPNSPGIADFVPLLICAPLAATATFRLGLARSWPVLTLAWTSALITAVIGLPTLVWLVERRRTGLRSVTMAMAAAGALPPIAAVFSAMAGHAMRGGLDYLGWVLSHGAPIPAYGLLPWRAFVRLELLSVLVGGIAGALCTIVPLLWRRGS